MLLSSIVEGLNHQVIKGNLDIEVSDVAFDSKMVKQNGLFVAITGFTTDGHHYINKAIEMGAKTIVVEKTVEIDAEVTEIKVSDSRLALARLSSNFYNRPTEKFNLVGITGTNGKTSITYFIKSILDVMKKPTGIIGTIGTLIQDQIIETKNTTPESLELQQLCDKMVKANISYCLMEVSSHALDLNRVGYCDFDAGIFTNLTPDHLELHKDMEHYFDAKAKLFSMTKSCNIINIDDSYGVKLVQNLANNQTKLLTYGLDHNADVYASHIDYQADYTIYRLNSPMGFIQIKVNIPGKIYVYNSLAAATWAISEGVALETISQGIDALKGIKGRFEIAYQDETKKVVIDFAHTEDGLEKALDTLRPFVKGRLLLVFGVYAAPGNLGIDKRIAMGKVAGLKADFSVVTSDNPKEQDPNAIIHDVVIAVESENGNYTAIVDRLEAIEYALDMMKDGDVLLISGKGHETAQVIGKVDVPFHEIEIVKNHMIKRNK